MSSFLKFLKGSNTGRLSAIWNRFWWTKIVFYKVHQKSTGNMRFLALFCTVVHKEKTL